VELERLFDCDQFGTQRKQADSIGGKCDPHNIGIEDNVKNVFIGRVCTLEEKVEIIRA